MAPGPLVPGQITVGKHMKPFQRKIGSRKLSGEFSRVSTLKCFKVSVHSSKVADTSSVNSYFNSNFGMKSCDWAPEV